jgi:hypothetical protein
LLNLFFPHQQLQIEKSSRKCFNFYQKIPIKPMGSKNHIQSQSRISKNCLVYLSNHQWHGATISTAWAQLAIGLSDCVIKLLAH